MALLQEVDEFFGDPDENPSSRQCTDGHELHSGLAVAESNATQSHYQKLGYHAAYDEHKDSNLQEGFEAGYKEAYSSAFRIGELLGEATMKLVQGKTKTTKSDDDAGNDPAYLEAVKKINGVLTDKEEKEGSSKKTYDLRDLQREVENILKS
jgi:flagellar biosynthesis/type III secretory pathway protein FliH